MKRGDAQYTVEPGEAAAPNLCILSHRHCAKLMPAVHTTNGRLIASGREPSSLPSQFKWEHELRYILIGSHTSDTADTCLIEHTP
jgi:hypothetical protein